MSTDLKMGHLSSKEIEQYMVEGVASETEAHLQGCWSCQAKLAEAKQPLAVFRTALVGWSEAQIPMRQSAKWADLAGRLNFMNWAPAFGLSLAIAVLAVFLVKPDVFYKTQVARVPAVSDAVLMEQVDSEVSEAVPDAMSPLTDLVSWESDEGAAVTPSAVKKAARRVPAKAAVAKPNASVTD